jgi:hypothetical protein
VRWVGKGSGRKEGGGRACGCGCGCGMGCGERERENRVVAVAVFVDDDELVILVTGCWRPSIVEADEGAGERRPGGGCGVEELVADEEGRRWLKRVLRTEGAGGAACGDPSRCGCGCGWI